MVAPLLLGVPWMDPNWLLHHFHTEFVWISLAIIFVECGLFFPFLPGDTLLFAVGLFIAGDQLHLNIFVALGAFFVAAFLGNVAGYEIGRRLGPPLYNHDGRILKRQYLDQTSEFFDRHGNKALVIGRFVPFVRTYITLVAGITDMGRRRFAIWSAVGAVAWVLLITLLGYFLGQAVPWLATRIDWVILGLLVVSVVPIAVEWWRHRRKQPADDRA
jgi:membrane-associated protein